MEHQMKTEGSESVELSDFYRHLSDDLRQIFAPMLHHNYMYDATALDIFFAYRLLLSRAPEDASATSLAERAASFANVSFVKLAFLNSPEFRDFYYGVSRDPEGRTVIVPDGDLRVAVSLDDLIIGWSIVNRAYEPATRKTIESHVRPGMTCIDLGANCGYFTAVLGSLVGPTGRVHSYEPFKRVFKLLQMTIAESRLSEVVTAYQLAASDCDATQTLYSVPDLQMGGSYVASSENTTVAATMQQSEIVTVTLDKHLAGLERLDFIKMDIEGSEVRALNGMKSLIETFRPIVLTEANASCLSRNGATREDLFAFFQQRHYTIKAIDDVAPAGSDTLRSISSPDEVEADANVLMLP